MMALGDGRPDFGQSGWMRPGLDASVVALRGKWVRLANGASGFILFELAENWVRLVNSDEGSWRGGVVRPVGGSRVKWVRSVFRSMRGGTPARTPAWQG